MGGGVEDSVIGATVTGANELGCVELIAGTAGTRVNGALTGESFGELVCGIETTGAFEDGAVVTG